MQHDLQASHEALRTEISQWMQQALTGRFECLKFRGGPGDEEAYPDLRRDWEQHLAQAGWTCVGWPQAYGGRGLTIDEQVIFHEEYAKAGGPGRMGHIGEGLVGPTLIELGTAAQREQFLPGIRQGRQYWCQGYSEPSAGSDLSNIKTRAVWCEHTGQWKVSGQKVWTSLAHESDWIFVLARCDASSTGHRGLIFLLMDLKQPGITIRPIRQLTGTCEFNEVFFDQAVALPEHVVGEPGQGWSVAMALLGFERGVSTLGQQMHFAHELAMVAQVAKANGSASNPSIRQRLATLWGGLRIMRFNALRMLAGDTDSTLKPEAMMYKYYWSNWHRDVGKLAMDVLGNDANVISDDFIKTRLQQVFLFSRADTIYAGTNEIQLNIIAERALGMPKEPRPA